MTQSMLNIAPKHLAITQNILKKYNASNYVFWAFGSRTTANTKPYSDLDIAIQITDDKTVPLKILANIQFDFIYSDLPFKVDVIDYNAISGKFKENVDAAKIPFLLE